MQFGSSAASIKLIDQKHRPVGLSQQLLNAGPDAPFQTMGNLP